MKSYKILAGLLFLVLVFSASSTQAYSPQGEGFVQANLFAQTDNLNEITIGNFVDFTIVVKNLWNDTISNITLTQPLYQDSVLMSFEDQSINGETINIDAFSVTDDRSGKELDFTYLKANESHVTVNLDMTLLEGEYFTLDFTMNFTTTGQFPFDPPTMTYYDHWGDLQTEIDAQSTVIQIVPIESDSRTQYIPSFATENPNFLYILGGFAGILVVALLGRVLHFKKPIEI